METEKVKGYINIAHKGGYLIIGGDTLEKYHKKLYLVLYDSNIQKNTQKIVYKLKENNLPTIEVDNLAELTNINNCKIIGIKNKNLSDIIFKLLNK